MKVRSKIYIESLILSIILKIWNNYEGMDGLSRIEYNVVKNWFTVDKKLCASQIDNSHR